MAKRRQPTRTRARTDEIVPPVTEAQVALKWRPHFQRLLQLRDELMQRRGDLVKDAMEEQPAFRLHLADAGTDNFDRDFALSMISSEQNAFYEVEEALRRIRDGSYGVCEVTGKPIEAERLNAIPWTRFSQEAEQHLEKAGAVDRRRLGNIERSPDDLSASDAADELPGPKE